MCASRSLIGISLNRMAAKKSKAERAKDAAYVRAFRKDRPRVDYYPDEAAMNAIEANRETYGSTSAAINAMLAMSGKATLTGDEAEKLDGLIAAEQREGTAVACPMAHLDAIREFQESAGHATLSDAIADLTRRAQTRLAEQQAEAGNG